MKLINYRAINSMINTVVASLFALCFISVCFSFALRFMSVCSPLCFRYTSVMPSLCHRFVNGGRSSSQRRMIEFTTKDERRMNEGRTEEYGDVTILEWGNMPKSALFVFLSHYLFDMLVYSVDLGYICICLIPLYIYIA